MSTVFYAPEYVLNAINTGSIVEGTNITGIRGQVKSIQIGFDNFDPSQLSSPVSASVNSQDTYIEMLDGQKHYLGVVYDNPMSCSVVNGDLQITFLEPWAQLLFESTTGSYSGLGIRTDNVYIAIDDISPNNYFNAAFTSTTNPTMLSSTSVIWSGNGGGGPSTPGLALHDGKVVGTVTDNPTQVEVTFNGQPLPTGSVVKFNGQKFLKIPGGSMEFLAVEMTPKAEWGWSFLANADWSVLQGF